MSETPYSHHVHLTDGALAVAIKIEKPRVLNLQIGVHTVISLGFITPKRAREFSASIRGLADWIDRTASDWEAIEGTLRDIEGEGKKE